MDSRKQSVGRIRRWLLSLLLSRALIPQASDVVWASRWDTYLAMSDVQIHWFAIVNSVVIVLFLSGKSFSICLIVYMFTINTRKRRVYMRMYDLKLYTVLSYVPNLHYQLNMCTLCRWQIDVQKNKFEV